MQIIYILTYRCNLNCVYCPVKKSKKTIKKKVIDKSLALLKNKKIDQVKIFGGEPLIEFKKLQYLIKRIRNFKSGIKILLTTNGVLLDKNKINWLIKNKIILTVSLDGNEFTQLMNRKGINSFKKIISLLNCLPKDTNYNLVIAPNTAKYFLFNFKYLVNLGIKKINLLPAYYNYWSEKQIFNLKKNFEAVINFIKINNIKKEIKLKNLENYSDITFFNRALVIDFDGKIYSTNAILGKHFFSLKKKFQIGDLNKNFNIKEVSNLDISNKIKKFTSKENIKINQNLDNILNNFIYQFKKI